MVYSQKELKYIDSVKNSSIGKLMIQFSIPAILSLLVGDFYNVSNTHYVASNLGTLGTASLSVTGNFFLFIIALSFLFASGTQVKLSVMLGKGEYQQGSLFALKMLITTGVVGVMGALLGIGLLTPLLNFLGTPSQLLFLVSPYVKMTLLGLPIFLLYFVLFAIFNSIGQFRFTLYMSTLFCVSNLWGVPLVLSKGYGLIGVASINVIASLLIVAILIFRLCCGVGVIKFSLRAWKSVSIIEVLQGCYIGVAYFLPFFTKMLVMTWVMQVLRGHGDLSLMATWGSIYRFYLFLYMINVGLRQSAMPLISFFRGYDATQCIKIYKKVVKYVFLVGIVVVIFIAIFSNWIMHYQLKQAEHGWQLLLFCLALPFAGVETVSLGYLQNVMSIKTAIIADIIDKLVLFLVAVSMVSYFHEVGYFLIYVGTSTIMSCVLFFTITTQKIGRIKRGV